MTNLTVNTINNMEEMLLTNPKVQKFSDTVSSGMDKATDFKKVLENSLEKNSENKNYKNKNSRNKTEENNSINNSLKGFNPNETNKIENNEVTKTIASIRETVSKEDLPENWAEFKEILSKITDEANIETSLDLTLARDINEIINQLKEAIQNTENATENSDESILSDYLINLDQKIATELENSIENIELNTNTDEINKSADTAKIQSIFEQLLAFINNKANSDLKTNSQELLTKNSEINLDLANSNNSEVIEITESLVDEIATVNKENTKTEEISKSEIELNIDEEILKELKIESLSAETNNSDGESFMQQQAPEEYAIKAMINQESDSFELKIDSVQNIQNNVQNQTKTVEINPSRIIDQIAKQMQNMQNNSKVTMVLNPESLGKVNIQLLTTKDGLTAQFTVATQEARDLIMKGLDGLKDTLISQGIGVDNLSVKVADMTKSEYKQDWTEQEGSRGGNKGQDQPNKEEKEKGLFEKMMAQTTQEENGNV